MQGSEESKDVKIDENCWNNPAEKGPAPEDGGGPGSNLSARLTAFKKEGEKGATISS